MTISVISARSQRAEVTASSSLAISPAGGVGTTSPGDLLMIVGYSDKLPTGISTGWTEFVISGTSGGYLRAAWRIADQTSADTCTYSYLLSGVACMGLLVARGTVGFDSTCIVNHSENQATAAGTTYALTSSLTGILTGQRTLAIGGFLDASTAHSGNNTGFSGTSWTNDTSTGFSGNTGIGSGDCVTTGTPAIPSITFTQSFSSKKFIVEFAIQEQAASGLAGGLFFGMH